MSKLIRSLAEESGFRMIDIRDEFDYGVSNEITTYTRKIADECLYWINDHVGMVDESARADLFKHLGIS